MTSGSSHSQARTPDSPPYRGRLAPSPTGYLHLGHARTFWFAQQRAQAHHGRLILRNEDLDHARCKPEFASAMIEDLRWFGFQWQEGPDCGGDFGPYAQSERHALYWEAFSKLHQASFVYPCTCSRKDILNALNAPHEGEDEPVYPGTCRHKSFPIQLSNFKPADAGRNNPKLETQNPKLTWRFRVPDGETISFIDGARGPQHFIAGDDFGDIVVWRQEGVPSYQLAVVVDDTAMGITEVVRGADLLLSTARQLLLYRALGLAPPAFYHCPLMTDERGVRLAKRHDALSLRALRTAGCTPESLRASW